jgi:hypothetical protein
MEHRYCVILMNPERLTALSEERIVEADELEITPDGLLIFLRIFGGSTTPIAWFALGAWHSVFVIMEDGKLAMLPAGVK